MQARTAAGWSDRRRRHNVKEEGHGVVFHLYEWTHKHFPNFVNCRPIFIARASEEAGFRVQKQDHLRIRVPVEAFLAIKDLGGR
jgi:demethylmenaquinone methyltransferase/2-methoxy-6-polyprenyl-1,4-benzoquinol methylase